MSRANKPAYPLTGRFIEPWTGINGERIPGHYESIQQGLTIREHFAAMAMQGLLTDPFLQESSVSIAERATVCADALIAELAKVAT